MSPETLVPVSTSIPAQSLAQLTSQRTGSQTPLREAPIDPNRWYVVARSSELGDRPLGVTLWQEDIVLFRDQTGQVQALNDCCPHRLVKLSEGVVVNGAIECAYHGWQFDATGACSHIPYLADNQKLPTCRVATYPVRELDGFIWLWPGDDRDALPEPMGLAEWEHLNYIGSVAVVDVAGHFSFFIENLMDMYHGHLHDNYQAWASAKLTDLTSTADRVDALYEAQSYYRINKIWSVAQLFVPALRQLHPEPLRVSYVYPHWASSLGEDFRIYCLFCPVSPSRTRAYLVHFTSLQAFWRLHKLPVWFRRWVKDSLFGAAKGLLEGLVEQDVLMIEQEQQAYWADPDRRGPELNRTLAAVQKLILDRSGQASPSIEPSRPIEPSQSIEPS